MQIKFVAYCTPQPQGSMKAFVLPEKDGKKARAILTSDNSKLKPYRTEVTKVALLALSEAGMTDLFAGKYVPVGVVLDFYLERPPSIPKKRKDMVVRPDLSKLIRSTEDAMTGVIYADDSQIVELAARKHYGSPERVEVSVTTLEGSSGEGSSGGLF